MVFISKYYSPIHSEILVLSNLTYTQISLSFWNNWTPKSTKYIDFMPMKFMYVESQCKSKQV